MEIGKIAVNDTPSAKLWPSYASPVAYILAVLFALALWPGEFGLDDAYITLSNARAILTGHDNVYGVSPLLGATSAVHLAIVTLFGLFLPLPQASALVSAIALVLYGAGLRALAEAAGCRGWRTAVIVFVGLFVGFQGFHYFNGLETGLAMASVAWALVLANSRYLPLLCGILPFVRPELAFLAAPLFFRRLYIVRDWQWSIGLALVAALPFAVWYLMETGVPFPNTGEAKIRFFAEIHLPLLERIGLGAGAIASSMLLILCIGLPQLPRVSAGWCVSVFLSAWLGLAVVTLPSLLTHNFFRYLAPIVPALCYPLAAKVARHDGPSRAIAAILVIWSVGSLAITVPNVWREANFYRHEGRDAAEFVRDHIPAGSTVLVHDAGLVAWLSPPSRLIDVVGLKTPESTTYHKRFTRHDCQWGEALSAIARDSGATYLVVLQGVPLWPCVGTNLQRQGWHLHLVRHAMGKGYAVYRITQP